MVITVYLNNFFEIFAGICETNFNLEIFFLQFVVMSFALGDNDEAPTTITSKQTKFPQVFKSKLKLVLHLPAKNFKEIVKIKCDDHKILDNFC